MLIIKLSTKAQLFAIKSGYLQKEYSEMILCTQRA